MKTFGLAFLLLFVAISTTVAETKPPTIESILQEEGQFAFSDGSSIFQFSKDGKFKLDPLGVSGRTIQGVWKTSDFHHFTVTGKWEWLNGVSAKDDYRRMSVYVSYHAEEAKTVGSIKKVKAYPVYHMVEGLVKITPEEYKKETAR